MEAKKEMLAKLDRFRIPILVLAAGLLLLILPGGSSGSAERDDPDLLLQEILCQTRGVGEARVLVSDKGVVVLCAGAEDPQVRLDIIRAINAYTGFGSDKITILKMADDS